MIEGYIKKIEDCVDETIIEVHIKNPKEPICPDHQDFSKDEQYENAEKEYDKKLSTWKELKSKIERLHIGIIEFKQKELMQDYYYFDGRYLLVRNYDKDGNYKERKIDYLTNKMISNDQVREE